MARNTADVERDKKPSTKGTALKGTYRPEIPGVHLGLLAPAVIVLPSLFFFCFPNTESLKVVL
jgi:hypothetical protein